MDIFKEHEPEFSRQRVNKLILIIQRSKDTNNVQKAQQELFFMMKKVVQKNVNNYLKQSRNSIYSDFTIENEEAVSECYIWMVKCVPSFRVGNNNCFYFYLNTSLRRMFRKILEDVRRQNEYNDKFSEEYKYLNPKNKNFEYSENLIVENLNLNETEKIVLKSKIISESKEDFIVGYMEQFPELELTKDEVDSLYKKNLKTIKNKLKIIIADEPRFKHFL